MGYTTQVRLVERFGERQLLQLTDRSTPPSGVIDAAVVERSLADTDAVIDGYLAGRYVLPLSVVPPLLDDLALSIAIYKLNMFASDPKIEQDYKDAVATLKLIALGTVRLPAAGIEPPSNGASGVQTIDRPRDLTPENLGGFI